MRTALSLLLQLVRQVQRMTCHCVLPLYQGITWDFICNVLPAVKLSDPLTEGKETWSRSPYCRQVILTLAGVRR
jgi:hypothetical protein